MTKQFLSIITCCILTTFSAIGGGVLINQSPKSTYQLQPGVTSSDYMANTIIIKVKPEFRALCGESDIQIPTFQKLINQASIIGIKKMFPHDLPPIKEYNEQGQKMIDLSLIYVLHYSGNADLVKTINLFLHSGIVVYAEPKFIPHTQSTPNDPSIGSQYFLTNIQAYAAWNISQGDTNVVIGITDTGTDTDHPDLAANIKHNYADPINGIDDDGDGYIDNFTGWDVGENDNDPLVGTCGNCSHGSHVSGCADAVTNNGVGVASPGYNCKFMPVKIADATGALTQAYEGIRYAADHGCQIINCSWGGSGGGQSSQDVINYATINKNSLVVVAAGNNGNSSPFYPASFDNSLGVAATTQSDAKASFSNFGNSIDVCAPGSGIYSTIYDNSYANESGTSMASPIVAGCAAIVKSFFPTYTARQIGERLRATCDNIDAVSGNIPYANKLGKGRVNLYSALTNLNAKSVRMDNISIVDSNNNILLVGDTMRIVGDITNYLSATTNLSVTLSTTSTFVTILDSTTLVGALSMLTTTNNILDPFVVQINPSAPLNSVVTFKLHFSDGTYNDFQYFNVTLNVDYINIEINDVNTTNTSKGRICFNSANSADGLGFNLNQTGNLVYESGFMVGISGAVSDNVRGAANGVTDDDFLPLSNIQQNSPSIWSDFDTHGVFDDSKSPNKLGLTITHRSMSWSQVPNTKFHIFEYTIKNTGLVPYNNLFAGIFNDWDIQNYNNNKINEDPNLKLGYAYCTDAAGLYAGVKLLTNGGFTHYGVDNVTGGSGGADLSNGYDDAEKFTTLSTNRATAGGASTGNDVIDIVGTGPFTLAIGDSIVVAFAMVAGQDLLDIQSSAQNAQIKYDLATAIKENTSSAIVSASPYPNPTNENVTLPYYLKNNTSLIFTVYDATGKLVMERLLGKINSGEHSVQISLSGLQSGLYHYRLHSDSDQVSGIIQKQ